MSNNSLIRQKLIEYFKQNESNELQVEVVNIEGDLVQYNINIVHGDKIRLLVDVKNMVLVDILVKTYGSKEYTIIPGTLTVARIVNPKKLSDYHNLVTVPKNTYRRVRSILSSLGLRLRKYEPNALYVYKKDENGNYTSEFGIRSVAMKRDKSSTSNSSTKKLNIL